jgi:hypothetical protein
MLMPSPMRGMTFASGMANLEYSSRRCDVFTSP